MEINVNATSNSVTINIDGTFTADELRALLEQIGQARAQIASDPDSPVGLPIAVAPNPAYWTEPLPQGGGSFIALRHPGYGWLGFAFTLAEAAKLSNYITGQLLAAATATATGGGTLDTSNYKGGGLLH